MDKETAIELTLKRWRRESFTWGRLDCMLSIADYINLLVGFDCAAQFRGRYSTRLGCMRVSRFHRDAIKPFASCAARAGLAPTKNPRRGDVGVVRASTETAGALSLGNGLWAAKAPRGLIVGRPSRVLVAFGAPC